MAYDVCVTLSVRCPPIFDCSIVVKREKTDTISAIWNIFRQIINIMSEVMC
jgi:hypothetical protein